MRDLFVRPLFDQARVQVSFTCPEGCTEITYSVNDGDSVVATGTVAASQPEIVFDVHLPEFTPWTVEAPFLYTLQMELAGQGEPKTVSQTFGMTKIHVQDRVIHFNNEPFYLRGHIRGREAHDHPNFLGCSMTEYYEKHIRMSKAYGFNFIRFHSRVPDDEFLEAADRLGMLVQVEIRKYWGKYQKERQMTNFDGDQTLVDEESWQEMILELRNHPCVLVYCMGNEINSPGNNDRVKIIHALTKKLDPTRLFLDTCSRGEYDRDTVDLDVQHMSYFAPFGKHYDMFDDSIHLSIYGSVTEKPMTSQSEAGSAAAMTRREVPIKFPLIAHEVCHYNILRDMQALGEKFDKYNQPRPWWIDETLKMIQAKGYTEQYQTMLKASTRFQQIWIKQCLESVRKSPVLQGFHFLQLSDTDRYENANGLLDCFDDPKDIPAEQVKPFNDETVVVADLPRRSYSAGEKITIPIHVSHYASGEFESATLRWSLNSRDGETVSLSGEMAQFDLSRRCNRQLCRIELTMPEVDSPQWLELVCELSCETNDRAVKNQWDLWLFPNCPGRIGEISATVSLRELQLNRRYPQIHCKSDMQNAEQLLITDRFNADVIEHLRQGKDALVLYRVQQNRQRRGQREEYYLPSTWDRFKGIIWDRGHNCGGFFREHPVVRDFPNDGFVDWQLYDLIEDCDKINLDGFPVAVDPILEGVDKTTRDRFDVGRFDLAEFQYAWTMRRFAYMFELRVGAGRLFVAGLNFLGLHRDEPATCWMFENIINYMQSGKFTPQASIEADAFAAMLKQAGQAPLVKERMMTQYWQLDDSPLESRQYWKESEEWLREADTASGDLPGIGRNP